MEGRSTAITDVTFNVTPIRTPFERPPDEMTLWSNIPRGLVHFPVIGGTLTAKAINDDEHLRISGALPANFAYQFAQIAFTLTQDVAASWNARPTIRCVNWTPNVSATTQHLVYVLEDAFEFADASAVDAITVLRGLGEEGSHPFGRQMIFSVGGALPSFSFLAVNETDPAGAAGTVDFFMSFFEFDLTQAVRFGLNTPMQTYGR